MSRKLNETMGVMTPDNLIYDNTFPVDTVIIKLRAGQGELLRGSVICMSSATNDGVIYGTEAIVDETLTACYILADDTDSTNTIMAECYRSGHFSRNNLITKADISITNTSENEMRNAGIFLSNTVEI